MKCVRGFSLLEVLAALALLALLLLGVYSGIRTATHSVRVGSEAIERVDQMRSAQQFMHRELAEATALPWSVDAKRNPVVFTGDAHEMRYVAPLPGYLGKAGPQLQMLKLIDEDDGTSRLEASFAILPMDGGKPQPLSSPEILLTGIRDGHFSYVARDATYRLGDWKDSWDDTFRLPAFVRIEMSVGNGPQAWPLDIAIRQSPGAINARGVARSLGTGSP
jgi:general secretion pathway protein J